VVMVALCLVGRDVIELAPTAISGEPAELIMTGVGLTLGAQLIGYLIAWAAWWLRHR
jgi:hypothetical protein